MILTAPIATLTDRERQVVHLLVEGNLNKQVAAKLGLAEKTIEYHRGNLMRKLSCDSVVDLVKKVWRPE